MILKLYRTIPLTIFFSTKNRILRLENGDNPLLSHGDNSIFINVI